MSDYGGEEMSMPKFTAEVSLSPQKGVYRTSRLGIGIATSAAWQEKHTVVPQYYFVGGSYCLCYEIDDCERLIDSGWCWGGLRCDIPGYPGWCWCVQQAGV
jgi:hypothetical protein